MNALDLTQDRLQEILKYSPESGEFRWVCPRLDALSRQRAGFETSSGYWAINISKIRFFAHRLAWLYVHGKWPDGDIDHLNGDKLDNRLSNLRDVPRRTNSENQREGRRGGLLGTAFHKSSGKWRAVIGVNYTQRTLGYFDTAEQAHEAYKAEKRKVHTGCTI